MTICKVNSQSILQVSANALPVMIEKWKKLKVGALFMDLPKAVDTLDHSLLLAKLSAYGFGNNSLSFVRSYLTNRIFYTKKFFTLNSEINI